MACRIAPAMTGARVFCSLNQLTTALEDWIKLWNEAPAPFEWTKTADQIIDRNLQLLLTHLRTCSLGDLRQWLVLERLVRPGVEDQRRQPGPVHYSNDLTQHDQMIACAV